MKKNSSVALIASGPIVDDSVILSSIKLYDTIIAIDGGANHCLRMGLIPESIIGDFDSSDLNLIKKKFLHIPLEIHPKEKDFSDLELALKKLDFQTIDKVTLFGALGNRTDHTLYNLYLTSLCPGKIFLESEEEIIFAINKRTSINTHKGQTLSLFPLCDAVVGITSKGLQWELRNETFNFRRMSLSNVATSSEVMIEVKSGILICCLNLSSIFNPQ